MDAPIRTASAPLVGREAQLARIERLLAAPAGAPGLVIHGLPGTGITALLAATAVGGARRGMIVARAGGVQAESGFPYAGLHQLFLTLQDDVAALAGVQRDDLTGALATGEGERSRVAAAAVAVLSAAARRAPVLVCVDEAQWLDVETCGVLGVAMRRLAHEPVAVVVGTHEPGGLADAGCDALPVTALAEPDAAALLASWEPDLAPIVRARVLRHAAGNPLALRELPAAYRGAGDGVLLSPWPPMTPRLAEAVAPGLEDLPADRRAALLRAAVRGDAAAGLTAPLGRAAVIAAASPAELQAAHAAVAASASDPAAAALHRAAAATGTDEACAAALADVARAAGDATLMAAGLRRAARLTPSGPARSRRLVEAAEAVDALGAADIAERLLRAAVPEDLDTVGRARLVALRRPTGLSHADAHRTRALVGLARETAAAGERELALRLLWRAAADSRAPDAAGDGDGLVAAARELAAEPDAPIVLSLLATVDARAHEEEILTGVAARLPSCRAADDLTLLGHAALVTGAPGPADEALRHAEPMLREDDRLAMLGRALCLRAWSAALTGDWERADGAAREGAELVGASRLPVWGALARAAAAMVAALRGDEERAEAEAIAAERIALPSGTSAVLALVQHARGLAALAAGRPAEAFEHLVRAFEPGDPARDRGSAPAMIGDLAEAATTAEHRARAVRELAECPSSAAPRLCVSAAHAELVLADDAAADAAFAAAVAAAGGSAPFDEARMLLVHGMRLRRRRRVADSRIPLRRAGELFAAAGAAPWAERARRELAATAPTSHREPGDQDQLTPQELEIAQLVALGRTNRDIAADLALSPRTVGHHLTRIYRKLGVSSRAEVARGLERV